MPIPSICVVKIQLPLAGDLSKALIYNEDGSINFFWPVDDIEDIMNGRAKAYFFATVDRDGQVTIGSETEEQDW